MSTRRSTQATTTTTAKAGRMVDTSGATARIAKERARDPELRAYLDALAAHPLLSATEETQIAKRLAVDPDDKPARDRLISANLRLVIPIAACYTGHGMPLLELISYGNIGLCEAVTSYDMSRGRFTTHASWQIRHAVSRSLDNLGDTIRISRTTAELHKRLATLEASEGELSDREAARRLHSTEKAIKRARGCKDAPVSLDRVTSDHKRQGVTGNATLAETIPDESPAYRPEEATLEALDTPAMRAALARTLAQLAPRDRAIIALRFSDDLSYAEIAARLGMEREAVRRAVVRILAYLRAGMEEDNTRITQALPARRRIAG